MEDINIDKIRALLSKQMATLDSCDVTGKKIETDNVTGYHYLAEFEIERIIKELSSN